MRLTWQDGPFGPDGDLVTLTAEFADRDGKPFYFSRAWLTEHGDRMLGPRKRIEREMGRHWKRAWANRLRQAEKLGVNVRDVPRVGDAVAPGHVFGVDWYVRIHGGMVAMVDVTRRRDGSPRTPQHLN